MPTADGHWRNGRARQPHFEEDFSDGARRTPQNGVPREHEESSDEEDEDLDLSQPLTDDFDFYAILNIARDVGLSTHL